MQTALLTLTSVTVRELHDPTRYILSTKLKHNIFNALPNPDLLLLYRVTPWEQRRPG